MSYTLRGYAQFTKSGAGVTPSSAPTCDVWQIARSNSAVTHLVTAGATTAIANGLYFYPLASADLSTNEYIFIFTTTDTTVDLQNVPALQQASGLADNLTTYTGNTPQTGDAFLRLGAPSGASVSADIAEIEADVDTLIAGVIVTTNNDKTGYALTPGEHTAIATDTQTGLTAQGYTTTRAPKLDNLDAAISTRSTFAGGPVLSVTGNVGGNVVGSVGSVTAGVTLAYPDSAVLQSGTAQAGTASTITLASGASATGNYVGLRVRITSGTGAGQARTITAYNGTTKVATVDWNWVTTPDNTSVYAVVDSAEPALNSSLQVATTASDPLASATPGSYALGTAGYQIGHIYQQQNVFGAGTVSVSPTPTTTTFTLTAGTGQTLNGGSNFYTTPTGMIMLCTSGANATRSNRITTHTVSGSNHAFTFALPWPSVPGNGDTFTITGY